MPKRYDACVRVAARHKRLEFPKVDLDVVSILNAP